MHHRSVGLSDSSRRRARAERGHVVTLCGQRFRGRTLDLAIAAAEAGGGAERERG